MKKFFAVLLSVVMALSCLSVCVSAYDVKENEIIILRDIGGYNKKSLLNIISGTTAECKSEYKDNSGTVYSIKAEQTLEKHWAFGIFVAVDNANWSPPVYRSNLSFTNHKYNLASGTYRLKTVFTTTFTNGQKEIITLYSGENTVS